jgi:hypothetical protein
MAGTKPPFSIKMIVPVLSTSLAHCCVRFTVWADAGAANAAPSSALQSNANFRECLFIGCMFLLETMTWAVQQIRVRNESGTALPRPNERDLAGVLAAITPQPMNELTR